MVLELCHCVHPDAGIEWWLGGWFSSMRFRDFTAMGPCVVWTMRSNVERSGGKFVIGNQLHDFFRLVKDLFDIFDPLLFFGVRWLNQIQFCRCGMIQENTKTWCATPQQLKMMFFSFASRWNLRDLYLQCKLEVFRIYCSFRHWFLCFTCSKKKKTLWPLWPPSQRHRFFLFFNLYTLC